MNDVPQHYHVPFVRPILWQIAQAVDTKRNVIETFFFRCAIGHCDSLLGNVDAIYDGVGEHLRNNEGHVTGTAARVTYANTVL